MSSRIAQAKQKTSRKSSKRKANVTLLGTIITNLGKKSRKQRFFLTKTVIFPITIGKITKLGMIVTELGSAKFLILLQ